MYFRRPAGHGGRTPPQSRVYWKHGTTLAADITVFDPETVRPLPEDIVHDFPAGGWRFRELAAGIHYTIVNGAVLIEDGNHTGALPGRVARNSRYNTAVAG